jgi:hypothetical protein
MHSIGADLFAILHFYGTKQELQRVQDNHLAFDYSNDTSQHQNIMNITDEVIPVFYNLFVDPLANETEIKRIHDLVNNQLALKRAFHKVYVNSIGLASASRILEDIQDMTLLCHNATGSEMNRLRSIYNYCSQHPSSKVVYLHSKGSYHPRPENKALRQFLTRGALLTDCSMTDPTTCHVCTSRFSPTPHPHNSGNMWTARCSYIKGLIPRQQFLECMAQVERLTASNNPACIGSRRMAAEHWVHSHPSVKPCDLFTDPDFQWRYQYLSSTSGTRPGDFSLQPAPRFAWNESKRGCMTSFGKHLQHRLAEYKCLYQQLPDDSWWGWKLWNQEFSILYNSTIPRLDDPSLKLEPSENPKW